jgi:ubiquinone biosynthesis protein
MASTIFQKFRNVGRLTQIINTLAHYGFTKEIQASELGDLIQPSTLERASNPDTAATTMSGPQRLSLAFETLGPTFVKLGQLLASRQDLLPKAYTDELSRLQDRAKPFGFDALQAILKEEFEGRESEIFSSIESTCVGAASIGQVHFATLRTGETVVLKVQRPQVEQQIRSDLSILAGVSTLLESLFPDLKALRPKVIVEELRRSLMAEIDYFKEAANTERMRQRFLEHPHIYIPMVHRDHSTRRVLCLEAIHGRKLTTLATSRDHADIVRIGVTAFLDMTFKFGTFHGDLHPGNFILMDDGRLAILDFGLTARLSRERRETLTLMIHALVQEDLESFSRLFVDMTEDAFSSDRSALERDIQEALEGVFTARIRDLQLGKILMDVARITAAHNAPVSRELILFFRALIALETFGRKLDPDFQILDVAKDYAAKMKARMLRPVWLRDESLFMIRDTQALLRELPFTLRLITRRAQSGEFALRLQADQIETLAREVDRASNRMSLALLLGALVIGSSIVTYGQKGSWFDSLATLGLLGFGAAGFVGLWLVFSIMRSGRFK